MDWQVEAAEIIAQCRLIATCTEIPGETTRLYLCDAMRAVHALVGGWMEAAGMRVTVDAVGNLRGRYESAAGGGTLLIGSHLDTVPNAGAFDGVLGVLTGVAAVKALQGERMPFAIEVVGFAEEEGVRFRQPFLGSLALAGRLDADLLALTDRNGRTVRETITEFGLDPGRITNAAIDPEATLGYLEVHIEQGPVLDRDGTPLGVVEAIAGQTRGNVRFSGQANHAGTTPMTLRHDALAAAAAWICGVEEVARGLPGLVATVGRLEVLPCAGNVIPADVTATLDLRHPDDRVREQAVEMLWARARDAAAQRGVSVTIDVTLAQPTVPMDAALTKTLRQAATAAGYRAGLMTSGAGHDAMVLAPHVPAAMLFVRSPGGISHDPAETVTLEDVQAGLETVGEFLRLLSEDQRRVAI